MNPVDVVILLKVALSRQEDLSQLMIARDLFISQSEVSKSLNRSRYAGLLVGKYRVMQVSLMEFIQYGLRFAFPQQPGAVVRGAPTAHSMAPLSQEI